MRSSLTFLDLLLLCVGTDDCDTRIPVDFEELEELGAQLAAEPYHCCWSARRRRFSSGLGLAGGDS